MNKIRIYSKVLFNYIKALISYFFSKKKNRDDLGLVIFNFRQINRSRNYAQFAYFFNQKGYRIILINHPLMIGNMSIYAKYILSLPFVQLNFFLPKARHAIYFYDTLSDKKDRFYKSFHISDDIYGDSFSLDKLSPYPVIPRLYFEGQYDDILSFRELPKKVRVYFSGNQTKEIYNNQAFKCFHKKLNRIEIIDTLLQRLSENEKKVLPQANSPFDNQDSNKFLLHQWVRESLKHNNISGRVSNDNWLHTLAKVDFFLACPGFVQPLCHNQIEAMSLGTILILEHPELFNPPLEHMKNCIVFSGKDDLVHKVKWALNASADAITTIREGVIKYYDSYLSPESFCKKVELMDNGSHTIYITTDAYVYHKLSKYL